MTAVRETSEAAGIEYVIGDVVEEADVIRSIWEEIARASLVLVDLTGFNANVSLKLGIAHTLGKKLLIVGQDNTIKYLFPSIQKLRVHQYDVTCLKQSLGTSIRQHLISRAQTRYTLL